MSQNIERVKRISNRMKKLCSFFIVLFPVVLVFNWLNFDVATKTLGVLEGLPYNPEYFGTSNIIIGFLINSGLTFLAVMAIIHLRRFFILNSEGQCFTHEGANALHSFSKYLLAHSILVVPVRIILSYVVTMNNPRGERVIQATLSTEEVAIIFLCFVFFAVSWLLKESVAIAEENAQII